MPAPRLLKLQDGEVRKDNRIGLRLPFFLEHACHPSTGGAAGCPPRGGGQGGEGSGEPGAKEG